MGEMSIKDLALKIDKSYEMTRRYVKGWAMPDDPRVLEAIANALNTSVGHLVADEPDSKRLPPTTMATEVHERPKSTICMVVEDEAMKTEVDGLQLMGSGDQVIISPARPIPGDIVAVIDGGAATLRKFSLIDGVAKYTPRHGDYQELDSACPVIGVVTSANARLKRFV